jgi:putative DNA primase/helicase
MGIALKHLSDPDRERLARELFDVREHDDKKGELVGLCPFHNEKNPSFSYNYKKDVYHCLSCHVGGDLVDLFAHVRGLQDPKEKIRAFKEFAGIEDDYLPKKQWPPAGEARPPAPPPPAPEAPDEGVPPDPALASPAGAATEAQPGDSPADDDEPVSADDLEAVFAKFSPLPEAWVGRLGETFTWTPEALGRLDLRQQTFYRSKRDGSLVKIKRPERVAIPIRTAKGRLVNIRLYAPGSTEMKIISWGKGYGKARLFPPAPLDAGGPVLLCEGEKDTITAVSNGFCAITQTGKLKTWPASHLEPFKGRDVVIAYDADQPGQKYAAFAAENLSTVAASVRMLQWPDWMGRQPNGEWPEKHGEDLTDFFAKHRKSAADLRDLIAAAAPYTPVKAGRPKANPAAVMQFFDTSVGGRISFKPRLLAEQVLRDESLLSDPATGQLYRWNGRWWELYSEDHVEARCMQYLGDEAQRTRVKDAAYQARILSTIPHDRQVNDKVEWVCLQNCMLDIMNLATAPHGREYYATIAMGVSFDPDGEHRCDRWQSFLRETVQTPEAIMQLQEFAGYCLIRTSKFGKCLLLLGPGSDGKSLYLKILRKLVGPENCAAVSFADLEDQFLRSSIYGKLLNISTEVGSKAMESPYFKAIATGDPIGAAFKHKDAFSFTPFCKLAFASNKMFRVLDNSDGFFRRLLPVTWKRQFLEDDPDTDPDLENTLEGELSGIFEWALVGLHRLLKQGRFTRSEETLKVLREYRRLNNPVTAFVEDECQIGEEYNASKDDLYKRFRAYCGEGGYSPFNKERFFRELYASVAQCRQYRSRSAGEREQRIAGVGLVSVDAPGLFGY